MSFINISTIFNTSRLSCSVLQLKNEQIKFFSQFFFCGCSFSRSRRPTAFCAARRYVPAAITINVTIWKVTSGPTWTPAAQLQP